MELGKKIGWGLLIESNIEKIRGNFNISYRLWEMKVCNLLIGVGLKGRENFFFNLVFRIGRKIRYS